jgi:hypothetical protein
MIGDTNLREKLNQKRTHVNGGTGIPKEDDDTGMRRTRVTTGLEDLDTHRIISLLDTATTNADRGRCVTELQKRFLKNRMTLGDHLRRSLLCDQIPRDEMPPPFPEPEPDPVPPILTEDYIKEVENSLIPYGNIVQEMLYSGWDFIDHRIGNVILMRMPAIDVRQWLQDHQHDLGYMHDLSEPRQNTLKMFMKVYRHWTLDVNSSK